MTKLLLLDYLVNAAWQAPLLAALAWLVCGFVPLAPRTRSWAWQAFLWLAILLPLLPENHVAIALFDRWGPFAWQAPIGIGIVISHGSEALADRPTPIWIVLDRAAEERVSIAFAIVASLSVFRFGAALYAMNSLVGSAERLDRNVVERLSLKKTRRLARVRYLMSDKLSYPVTLGALRPLVLLPKSFGALKDSERRAVLLHELEHIRRWDFIGNLVVELFSLALYWHPAVGFLKGRVRASREFACDAGAASQMGATTYAENLVSAVQSLTAVRSGPPPPFATGLFGGGDLLARVREVTAARTDEGTPLAGLRISFAVAVATLTVVLVVLAPIFPCVPAAYHAAHVRNGVWRP